MRYFDFLSSEVLPKLSGSLPSDHRRMLIASGPRGTEQTIHVMQQLVAQGKRDFRVRDKLYAIIASCSSKDYYCYAKALYEFCRDQIKYVFDPNGVELVESPYRVLESRVADCDSIVMLLAALCEQAGLRCRYVTIKADAERPDEYSHVYLQISVPGHGWVSADPTMPLQDFGWEPDPKYPRTTWSASSDAPEDREGDAMTGLGMVPGAQASVGVLVDKKWQWQMEPDEDFSSSALEEAQIPHAAGGMKGLGVSNAKRKARKARKRPSTAHAAAR